MASNYPGSLDSFDTIASDKKQSDSVGGRTHRQMHNDLGDAIEAVQGELGTTPSGAYATVKARFEAIEGSTLPQVDAKGDLIVGTADNTYDNLGVGTNDTVLLAASGETKGVKWAQVPTAGIADDAVTAAKIAADAVDAAALAASSVTTAKIAANAVTDDKIASGVTFTVGSTPPVAPKVGAEWADTSSPPITVIRKWDGTSWLVWIVTDATVPSIGDAAWGGYMAGIIDTTRVGSIGGTDPSQVGLRYLLIVSPKSIEFTTGKKWKTTDDAGPNATKTLWDGLSATEAMFAAGPEYEAATYCRGLAFPADGGSRWYLPAKHELEVLYRNFKPTTEPHYNASGTNPASDPTGTAYVPGATTAPAQSLLAAFQQGGAQALEGVSSPYYWSSSEYSAPYAWLQYVGGSFAGYQGGNAKTGTIRRVRPVRRFVL